MADFHDFPMNFKKWIFSMGIAFVVGGSIAQAEELKCHAEKHYQDGGKHITDMKLILEGDLVVGLVFDDIDSFVAKGNPMAIWACSVDTTHLDNNHRIKWSRKGKRTFIEIIENDTQDKSTVRIEKSGNRYKVFFVAMSQWYSGMSKFPVSVLIEKGNETCSVDYR